VPTPSAGPTRVENRLRDHALSAWAGPLGAWIYLWLQSGQLSGEGPRIWFAINVAACFVTMATYAISRTSFALVNTLRPHMAANVTFVTGLAWGLMAFMALPTNPDKQAYALLFLAASTVSVVGSTESTRSFLLYEIPTLGLPFVAFLLQPATASKLMAIGVAVFFFISLMMSKAMTDRINEIAALNATLADQRDALAVAHEQVAHALASSQHQAKTDALTGLGNRRMLIEQLDLMLTSGEPLATLFVDLDDFKAVNDSRGHEVGDRLLTVVAQRFSALAPAGAIVCRLGGDEFAVIVPGSNVEVASTVAEALLAAAHEPVTLDGCLLQVNASIGVAMSSALDTPADVLRHADAAMYQAKQQGRGQVAFFTEQLSDPPNSPGSTTARLRAGDSAASS
jgi:diguanylate cyclase (GGDEF)-like protein